MVRRLKDIRFSVQAFNRWNAKANRRLTKGSVPKCPFEQRLKSSSIILVFEVLTNTTPSCSNCKRDLADRLLEGADAAGRLNTEELLELLRQPVRQSAT